MKTYQAEPKISAEEYIRLDGFTLDYAGGACKAPEILAAWLKKQESDTMPHGSGYKDHLIRHFGAMFLFECGRIYGIRQERARKKAL